VRLFSSEEDWSCKVSLRFEVDVNGDPLSNIDVVPFGETITDPLEVQQRLIQAQRAVLNPNKPLDTFLSDRKEPGLPDEVQFSENFICIEVNGQGFRDLSLVDVPGLIANVGENEHEGNIELIRKLAKKVISKPNCVILSCITMSGE
jgi:hypothetical protein